MIELCLLHCKGVEHESLCAKRPRKEWDPMLWEVPLCPLPKCHMAHWEPNEYPPPLS